MSSMKYRASLALCMSILSLALLAQAQETRDAASRPLVSREVLTKGKWRFHYPKYRATPLWKLNDDQTVVSTSGASGTWEIKGSVLHVDLGKAWNDYSLEAPSRGPLVLRELDCDAGKRIDATLTHVVNEIDEHILYEQAIDPYPLSIIVPTMFGRKRSQFVLDTGAYFYLCDPSLKTEVGAATEKRGLHTFGGLVDTEFFHAPKVRIGGLTLLDSEAGMMPMHHIQAGMGFPVEGILGGAGYHDFALWLDYDRGVFKILQRVSAPPAGMQRLPLELNDGKVAPYIKVKLGPEEVVMHLDLGSSNGALHLSSATFGKLAAAKFIDEEESPAGMTIAPSGLLQKTRSGKFTQGELFGMPLQGMSATLGLEKGSDLIGLGFLVNYNFIIDFPGRSFYWQARDTPPPVNVNRMLGAGFMFDQGDAFVVALKPGGGAAETAGIKKGDRITRLGPIKHGNFNMKTLYELCRDHANRTIEVELRRQGLTSTLTPLLKLGCVEYLFPGRESEKARQ